MLAVAGLMAMSGCSSGAASLDESPPGRVQASVSFSFDHNFTEDRLFLLPLQLGAPLPAESIVVSRDGVSWSGITLLAISENGDVLWAEKHHLKREFAQSIVDSPAGRQETCLDGGAAPCKPYDQPRDGALGNAREVTLEERPFEGLAAIPAEAKWLALSVFAPEWVHLNITLPVGELGDPVWGAVSHDIALIDQLHGTLAVERCGTPLWCGVVDGSVVIDSGREHQWIDWGLTLGHGATGELCFEGAWEACQEAEPCLIVWCASGEVQVGAGPIDVRFTGAAAKPPAGALLPVSFMWPRVEVVGFDLPTSS